jgi:membrane protein implicated in regulation of membrane protease activity
MPKRPYRDTVLVYGGMAIVVVLAAWATGGDLLNAVLIAGLFFLIATAWTWRRFRERLRAEARKEEPR